MKPAQFCRLFGADDDFEAWAVANCKTMREAWAKASSEWVWWIATRPGVLTDRELRLCYVQSAIQVERVLSQKCRDAIAISDRYANGQATDAELIAAWDAARSAAMTTYGAWDAVHGWSPSWSSIFDPEQSAPRAALAEWIRANTKPDWKRARKEAFK